MSSPPESSFHRMRKRRDPPARASGRRSGCPSWSLSFARLDKASFSSRGLQGEVPTKPFRREKTDRVRGLAVQHQIGEDLAEHARELEPVARAGRRHDPLAGLNEV